ncbi:hypothetical protein JHD46_01345 [Sulfurimonas sp. SAG-AH-194-C20]|nr:hypothetical protein [Sulfurimonas sp. SAG-AH-194-C20]MDF1878278.1 hypothetical protein [Sulfurimonas sp. SAG-AH-194-C20]
MMKIITAITLALLFVACGSKEESTQNVEAKLVIGKSLNGLTLQDQFEKVHTLKSTTATVVFAFDKESAHTCNDYFETKEATYLSDNNTEFIADVSAAPSIIKSLFILPGLKDFKHTVLLLNEKAVAAPFRKDMDVEKIIALSVEDGKITKITAISTQKELIALIEAK